MAVTAIATTTVSAAEQPAFGIVGGLHRTNLAFDPDPTGESWDPLTRANIGGFALFVGCLFLSKGSIHLVFEISILNL